MADNSRTVNFHIRANKDNQSNLLQVPYSRLLVKPFISLVICNSSQVSFSTELLAPHSSRVATIIFLVSGEATYSDSTNKNVVLKKDDLLWILSGSGISHSLKPSAPDCTSIKVIVELSPALEHAPPQSIYVESSFIEQHGPAKIILGRYGDSQSAFALPALINYLAVTLDGGKSWIYEPPINHSVAWATVISGKVKTSNIYLSQEESVIYEYSNKAIEFFAEEDSILLIGSSVACNNDFAAEEKYSQQTKITS